MTKADRKRCYLLHYRNFSETSLVLELLTIDGARIAVLAKGIRRSRKGISQAPVQFCQYDMYWKGRSELPLLISHEATSQAINLNGERLYSALYLNEMLMRVLMREDDHPGLFNHYEQALNGLAGGEIHPVLRQFELALLQSIGYGLALPMGDQQGMDFGQSCHYRYADGHFAAASRGPDTISGAALKALLSADYGSESLRLEMRDFCRELLRPHLGNRPLRSQVLIREFRNLGRK